MKNIIIIVENQKKLQTYTKILGKEPRNRYRVFSTGGYINKIKSSSSKLGWIPNDKSKSFLDRIVLSLEKADEIYLAMDDDENGERLAWDTMEYLGAENIFRITCRELNLPSVKKAIDSARVIDKNRINAQIARKSVENIIGNSITKLMKWWFKKENIITDREILETMGIGRVSAPALALIVQAEESIDTFIAEDYKRVFVDYFKDNMTFTIKNKLKWKDDKKEELLVFFNLVKNQQHVIYRFKRDTKDKTPPPPLNAIWLQRTASYQFGYSPKETMSIAKELYEGVDIDGERVGLITYPKTNSIYISDEAIYEMVQLVLKAYGEKYTFQSRRVYKNKNQDESKEAIRPISFSKEYFPDKIKRYLTDKQYTMYKFIYQRTIATQMSAAIYDQSELVVQVGGRVEFKGIANKMIFDGWKIVGKYWEDDEQDSYEEITFPDNLVPGETLKPLNVRIENIPARSPWRYGEGRFITTLQNHNIANGSSTAEITYFLEKKKYIRIEKSMIYPTETGKNIYYFIKLYAPWLIDLEYLAKFENDIMLVEKGEKNAKDIILEYETLRNETQLKLDYDEDGLPEKWLVDKAKKIAKQNGQILNQEILSNRRSILYFIKENAEEVKTFGICPDCKEGEIFENEHGYRCNNENCHFMLWQNSIDSFLEHFSKEIPKNIQKEYISIILNKGKCYIHNLYSSKKEKFFDSFVILQYSSKYKNWSLSLMDFDKKEEIDKKDFMPSEERASELEKEEEKKKRTIEKKKLENENELLKKRLKKEREERRLIIDSSLKDPMTRAYNRGCFDRDIEKLFLSGEKLLSIGFIDGDKFKNINDTYGHQAGDLVLQFLVNKMFEGAKHLKRTRVYRYGGEEFIVVFAGEAKKDVINCLNSIRKTVEKEKVNYEDTEISITISIGVAFREEDDTVADLIKRADDAVYRAKEDGRNRIEVGMI